MKRANTEKERREMMGRFYRDVDEQLARSARERKSRFDDPTQGSVGAPENFGDKDDLDYPGQSSQPPRRPEPPAERYYREPPRRKWLVPLLVLLFAALLGFAVATIFSGGALPQWPTSQTPIAAQQKPQDGDGSIFALSGLWQMAGQISSLLIIVVAIVIAIAMALILFRWIAPSVIRIITDTFGWYGRVTESLGGAVRRVGKKAPKSDYEEQFEWFIREQQGGRSMRRIWTWIVVAIIAILVIFGAWFGATLLAGGNPQSSIPLPAASQQQQPSGAAEEQKPSVQQADEDAKRLEEIKKKREAAKAELQGVKLSPGQTTEPSFMDRFGWWILGSLLIAVLIAAFTPWRIQQTIPVAVGIAVMLMILQNWWIFLIVACLLALLIVGRGIRNALRGGARGVRGVAGALPQGASLFVIWEIIQTLWTNRFVGAENNQNNPLQRARQQAQPAAPNQQPGQQPAQNQQPGQQQPAQNP